MAAKATSAPSEGGGGWQASCPPPRAACPTSLCSTAGQRLTDGLPFGGSLTFVQRGTGFESMHSSRHPERK